MAIGRLGADLYLIDADGHVIDEYGPNYAQFDLPDHRRAQRLARPDGRSRRRGPRRPGQPAARRRSAGSPALLRRVSQIDVSNTRDAVVLLEDDTTLVHLGDDQFLERLQSYVDLSSALHERVTDIEYADVRFDNHIYVRPAAAARKAAAR